MRVEEPARDAQKTQEGGSCVLKIASHKDDARNTLRSEKRVSRN